jgi:hypothetical protein
MPLMTPQDAKDKNKVFQELRSTYGQQRARTIAEFNFSLPPNSCFDNARPPNTARMQLLSPTSDTGVIYVAGISVATGKPNESRVGSIKNH